MPTREEIREGIKELIGDCLINIGCASSGCPKAEQAALEAQDACLQGILKYLHDNDVVIKVDRELPEVEEDNPFIRLDEQAKMLGAGYVRVEPLI